MHGCCGPCWVKLESVRVELVIFDCDGVLVDSEPLANEVLRDALAGHGLVLTLDQVVGEFVGHSMTSVQERAETMLGRKLPDDFIDRVQARTFDIFRDHLKPVSGVEDVIRELQKKGMQICIASSGSHDKMDLTLTLTGLKHYFGEHIFSSYDVARGKPYPDLYLHAAREMGVDPALCLVIEDSLPGVQGAVAAGMEVMAYSVRAEDLALKRAGGLIFSSMAAIGEHLNPS